jgi:c-di-GMP-binding flagellar brake protein YcgR
MSAKPQVLPVEVLPFEDRRQAPRAELNGTYSLRIDPCDGREPVECPVLDFSVTGMRIELPENLALPNDVQVLIGNISHNARVVWRKDNVAGIDLIEEHHSIIY